jgi:hypothetical protein
MKAGQQARDQYAELTTALRELGAGWIVDEVEELITLGRTVVFSDLPPDEKSRYRERLQSEARKGIPVGKARAADEIGLVYGPEEQLALLVNAAERAIVISARSHASVVEFASRHHLQGVTLREPVVVETAERSSVAHELPMSSPQDVDRRLAALSHMLRSQVLE